MEKANSPKTTIFNLIILDESGSMMSIKQNTVSGCNELLNVIRSAQSANSETQRNLVSIYAFQSDNSIPSRYLIKNAPIQEADDLTGVEYRPNGCTPLLDAIGATLTDLRAIAATHEDAMAIVTIITDGLENSSKNYDLDKVTSLINACKELGWTINFIGGDIDNIAVSRSLNIDNTISFNRSAAGSQQMWKEFSKSVQNALEDEAQHSFFNPDERIKKRKMRSKKFFNR